MMKTNKPASSPPTVSAGDDQQVAAGTVTLTGSAQSGSTVLWTVTRASDGGSVSVTNSTSTTASFTGVQGQSYTATLTATLAGVSAQDSSTIACAAVALPTVVIADPAVFRSGLSGYVVGATIGGAASQAWACTRITAAGVESDGSGALDSTTAEDPTLTPVALGDTYLLTCTATSIAGGTASASAVVTVLDPDKLTFTEIDLSTYVDSIRAGSGDTNPIDLATSTLTTGGSTLGHGALTAQWLASGGALFFELVESMDWSAYAGLAVKLVHGAFPNAGVLRGLGVGIFADATPAAGEGLSAWNYETTGDADRVSCQTVSDGMTTGVGSTPAANDLDTLIAVFSFSQTGPRAVSARGQAGSTIRCHAGTADAAASFGAASLILGLMLHANSASASTFPGVRLSYSLIPVPT